MSSLGKWKGKLGFIYDSCYDAAVEGDLEEIKKYKAWYDSIKREDPSKVKFPKYFIELYNVYKGFGEFDLTEGALLGKHVEILKYVFEVIGKVPEEHTLLYNKFEDKLSVETLDYWLSKYPVDSRVFSHFVYKCDLDLIRIFLKYMKPTEDVWQTACILKKSSEVFKLIISSIDTYKDHCLDSTCVLIAATRSDKVGAEIFDLACKHAHHYTTRLVLYYDYFQHTKLHEYAQDKVLNLIIENPQRFRRMNEKHNDNTILANLITRETFINFVQQDNLKACEIIYNVFKDWYQPPFIIFETDGSYYRASSELKEWLKTHKLMNGSKLCF